MERVHIRDVLRVQGLRGPAGTEAEDSVAERVRRNGADYRDGAGVLTLLIVEEIENAVRNDLPADGGSELIAHERRAGNSGVVVEPVIGGEEGVAVVFVERTVKLIG